MLRPSSTPTIADLYLAFRQAKAALYFEKRGIGLLQLAEYEQQLPKLESALDRLFSGKWKKGAVPPLWDGGTAERVVTTLERLLARARPKG